MNFARPQNSGMGIARYNPPKNMSIEELKKWEKFCVWDLEEKESYFAWMKKMIKVIQLENYEWAEEDAISDIKISVLNLNNIKYAIQEKEEALAADFINIEESMTPNQSGELNK